MSLRQDQALIAEWIAPGSRVLDLGCGDGALLVELRRRLNVSGYGIEIDRENIVRCLEAGVNVIHGNLDQGLQDFDDDSFDYVIMTQTLQAMRYPHLVIREMLRVGREGIVTFPNFGHWKCRLQLLTGQMPVTRHLPSTWYDTANIHMCTIRDFEALCATERVEVLERAAVDSEHRAGFAMRFLPNLLAEIAIYRFRRKTVL
ncbi:MAG: methionine biosynthesis protein MetW [Gammaproteobacteria bacterium]|nr:methionine biosynthesis protein MetW [Gammaproteobacteria bacterium]MBI5616373.1 methionine biosynthesis protein MetW [Gammaproteobacteria bacterium]